MAITPENWNVTLLGAWNRAILTPAGIATRLLERPEGEPIGVDIPIDGIAPIRVRHEALVISAGSSRIDIGLTSCSFANLGNAMQIGARALQKLPETPVRAAGFNIAFAVDPVPVEATRLLDVRLDDSISDAGFAITERKLSRSLELRPGQINVHVTQANDQPWQILLNFHRESSQPRELIEWLQMPTDDIQQRVQAMLGNVLRIPYEVPRV